MEGRPPRKEYFTHFRVSMTVWDDVDLTKS